MLTEYDGKLVWQLTPTAGIKTTFTDNYALLGEASEKRSAFRVANALLKISYTFEQISRAERTTLLKTFKQLKGAYENFYMRTFVCAYELVEDYNNDTTIKLKNVRLDLSFDTFVVGMGLYHDNFTAIPIITDATISNDVLTLTLDVEGGASLPAGTPIEPIFEGRLAGDSLTFSLTDLDISSTNLTFITARLG